MLEVAEEAALRSALTHIGIRLIVVEQPTLRLRALEIALAMTISAPNNLSADRISNCLLYGLDHEIISYAEASGLLLRTFGATHINTIRFATRQIEYDGGGLWKELWRVGSDYMREWLLIAAVDFLGDLAYDMLDIDGLSAATPAMERLQAYLREWNGGLPGRAAARHADGSRDGDLLQAGGPDVQASAIVLGFSGVGKSTVGTELGRLDVGFADLDALAISSGDPGLARLFMTMGATLARRELLNSALYYLRNNSERTVVICGGAVTSLRAGRRAIATSTGPVVLLTASRSTIVTRIRSDIDHALHAFCGSYYSRCQLRRIQRLREDHYYASDLKIVTDGLQAKEVARAIMEIAR